MAQSRSYSYDKMMMRQADWDISDLITKFLPSLTKIKIIRPGHYLQHLIVYIYK
jgi:hypothetical protein